MHFYPAGESVMRRLLELPQQRVEWIVTGAKADDMISAGFMRDQANETRFLHPESGDLYQLARRQLAGEEAGHLRYECDQGVTLENELATRVLTIVAMASDGHDIIDPFDGQDDLNNGVLRHVTPDFVRAPQNLLTVAVWAASLKPWDFSIAHETFRLMKQMVARGDVERIAQHVISETVVQALATHRPSEYFRVLYRCGALAEISPQLDVLFEECKTERRGKYHHAEAALPDVMQCLDQVAAETGNISSVMKRFYDALGNRADRVFVSLGLDVLFRSIGNDKG